MTDLARLNRLSEDSELESGETLRIPNPFLARERELTTEIDRLSLVIEIGGMPVRVNTTDPGFLAILQDRYSGFVSENDSQDAEVEFDVDISRTAFADFSALRAATTTCAPARASPRAMPRPMPPLPPVTIATRSLRSNTAPPSEV